VTTSKQPLVADDDLARRLGVPVVAEPKDARFLLQHRVGRLEIRWTEHGGPSPLCVDFAAGTAAHRIRAPSLRLPLARAAGVGRGTATVLDATAGLGRDAFVLAALGCRVLAVERSPVVFALLEDGLRRALAEPSIERVVGDRLELLCGDARDVMRELRDGERPDAVLLDPMLGRLGSARVKKDTRLLQELLPPATEVESAELLALARRTAKRRAVVKRPLRAPPVADDCAVHIASSRVRWDVYLIG
jgi:16S rRNA (guanine1516-N2)-methyltransferase